ncbi:unnamed protein product [Strongylus vulgaris]|uniref:Uncharacterized protein n=1 Tax=Strongylus vulgaris TaxID=40348 RepID=A0A3P7J9N9_STRVU|nr:unnamed protein product [Strongylus vulgaris]
MEMLYRCGEVLAAFDRKMGPRLGRRMADNMAIVSTLSNAFSFRRQSLFYELGFIQCLRMQKIVFVQLMWWYFFTGLAEEIGLESVIDSIFYVEDVRIPSSFINNVQQDTVVEKFRALPVLLSKVSIA